MITEQTKHKIIQLKSEGLSDREVEEQVNIPRRTINDFMNRRGKGNTQWWDEYEQKDSTQEEQGEVDIDELCDDPDWHVANLAKRLRTQQRTNAQLRRALNGGVDVVAQVPDMLEAIRLATERLNAPEHLVYEPTNTPNKDADVIYEILLSDYQIGKKGQYYNSELAERAMCKYGNALRELLNKEERNVKKIILALLGDLVEDHLKHGVQSAISTDCGLSEQMAKAIEHLWKYIVKPLAEYGVKVEVMCIAGNHGSSQHKGMDVYKAGLYAYDYVIYKTLEGYCTVSGYNNVKFIIPEGVFGYLSIFDRYAVYSHGYDHDCTEKALEGARAKRSNQLKRHVEYYRSADMHHVCNYDNGKLVVNGAFFGTDTSGEEYSGVLGFSAVPAQVVMVHMDDQSVGRNTVKETHVIQVADGY